MEVGGERHALAALPLRKKSDTYCSGGGIGAPGSLWTGMEASPPPGFEARTVQPVADRNTEHAITAAVTETKGSQDVPRIKPINRTFRQPVPYRGTKQTTAGTVAGTSKHYLHQVLSQSERILSQTH